MTQYAKTQWGISDNISQVISSSFQNTSGSQSKMEEASILLLSAERGIWRGREKPWIRPGNEFASPHYLNA